MIEIVRPTNADEIVDAYLRLARYSIGLSGSKSREAFADLLAPRTLPGADPKRIAANAGSRKAIYHLLQFPFSNALPVNRRGISTCGMTCEGQDAMMGVKLRDRVGLVGAISELRESQLELVRKGDKQQRAIERIAIQLERAEDESENTAVQSRQEIVDRARKAELERDQEREARLKETKADTARWFRLVVILLSGGSVLAAILKWVFQ